MKYLVIPVLCSTLDSCYLRDLYREKGQFSDILTEEKTKKKAKIKTERQALIGPENS